MPYQVTEEQLADRGVNAPFVEAVDSFCAKWLDANCDSDDLKFMKSVRPFFWGPGVGYTEVEYLGRQLGRSPRRVEAERIIARRARIMERCFAAMEETPEYIELKRADDEANRATE